jgi:hypothetical protein
MKMAIEILENGMVSDRFEIGTAPHILRDAIVMMPSEYDKLTPEELQAMKQSRYDRWWSMIKTPPADVPVIEAPQDTIIETPQG